MKLKNLLLAAVVCVLAATTRDANATTYTVNQSFGGGGVTGTIDTDGTIGTLGTGNITDWSLMLTDLSGSFLLDGLVNSAVLVLGSAFSATVTDLLFDFSAGSGLVIFQNPNIGSSINFWCMDNGGCSNLVVPGQSVVTSDSSWQNYSGGAFTGSVIIGSTSVSAVPLPAALPLLAAGLGAFGFVGWRRRKTAA